MYKSFSRWRIAALALALSAPACFPARGQQTNPANSWMAPDAMSASDKAVLLDGQNNLVQAARIYGYTLENGNWGYEQAVCPPMEGTIMLHYFRHYLDGSDSLFTALIPRKAGRIRIVPVLYHSTTPYTPAPRNPRNYAVFNELVSGRGGTSGDWLELSACYAELTGAPADLGLGGNQHIGIAGAPLPTVHLNPLDQSTRVTFSSRESARAYKVWNISFNHHGQVIAAATEDFSVPSGTETKTPESQSASAAGVNSPKPTNAKPERQGAVSETRNYDSENPARSRGTSANQTSSLAPATPSAPAARQLTPEAVTNSAQIPEAALVSSAVEPASSENSSAGWKLILHPSDPPAKFIPQAAPPPEKIKSEPPDPTAKSSQAGQQE